MIDVQIDDSFSSMVTPELILSAAHSALVLNQAADNSELSIVLTNDNTLRDLNFEFRQVDAPTDVLSFPSDEIDPETGNKYIGDIVISVDRANEQAQKGHYSLQSELQLLTVHGVLHLLGYDHLEKADQIVMWNRQKEILISLNCDPKAIPTINQE
ncbi:MAG TPA: rRNA maturation RNase YbeY [Anaerolineaceae bacterium]